MQFYVPEIGDEIRLTADWTFDLFDEYRNETLMQHIGDDRPVAYIHQKHLESEPCTIPAGSILKIDRIYIRKGNSEFSSITFIWKDKIIPAKIVDDFVTKWDNRVATKIPHQTKVPKKAVRFWAKLDDANKIEFEKM